MTSAVRYPVSVRRRDESLANYPGPSPEFVAHPWLRSMAETTLAGELSALRSAIVVPLGPASPVDAAEPCRVVAEQGAGQHVPSRAVRTEPSRLAIFASTPHSRRAKRDAPGAAEARV
jgi:hypothetical protein